MGKPKIIIVDNDIAVRTDLRARLEDLGYDIISTTGRAEDAIEQAGQLKPDIILMDIKLDGQMDGIQAADIIRQRFGIPIVFFTAYVDEYKLEQFKATIPFGILLKPVQERDLRFTVEMALHVAKVDEERTRTEKEQQQRIVELSEANDKLRIHQAALKQQIDELKKDAVK